MNCGRAIKWVIMLPSLLRSSRSYLFHNLGFFKRVSGMEGEVRVEDEASASTKEGWSAPPIVSQGCNSFPSSLALLPRESPNKFVVGVPVTIHLRSTLKSLAKGTKMDDSEDETWPSSMIKRFHLICKKGEMFGAWHLQLGIRYPGYSGHMQGRSECSFAMSDLLDSVLNPVGRNLERS